VRDLLVVNVLRLLPIATRSIGPSCGRMIGIPGLGGTRARVECTMDQSLQDLLAQYKLDAYRECLETQELDVPSLALLTQAEVELVCGAWPIGARKKFIEMCGDVHARRAVLRVAPVLSDIDRALIDTLPTPLARAFESVCVAADPVATKEAVSRALEALLRILALCCQADYLHAHKWHDLAINDGFRGLERPTCGKWLAFVRLCLASAKEHGHDLFLRELADAWSRLETGKPISKEEVTYDELGQPRRTTGRLGTFEWLVSRRNAYAHDRIDPANPEFAEAYRNMCLDAFRECRWLCAYECWLGAGERKYLLRGCKPHLETSAAPEELHGTSDIVLRRRGALTGRPPWRTLPLPPLAIAASAARDSELDSLVREREIVFYSRLENDSITYTSGPGTPYVSFETKLTISRLREFQDSKAYRLIGRDQLSRDEALKRIRAATQRSIRILDATGKYQEHLHVKRRDYEPRLLGWINSTVPMLGVAAEAGAGKTGILANLVGQWMQANEKPVLFLLARDLQSITNIDRAIHQALTLRPDVTVAQLSELVGGLVVVIDGLNEHPSRSDVLYTVTAMARESLKSISGPRFALSWRTEDSQWMEEILATKSLWWIPHSAEEDERDNPPARGDEDLANRKSVVETQPADFESEHTSPDSLPGSVPLSGLKSTSRTAVHGSPRTRRREASNPDCFVTVSPLSDREVEEAWKRYQGDQRMHAAPSFSWRDVRDRSPGLARQLRNPLQMRITMECYDGQNLPERIGTEEVFARYLNKLRQTHPKVPDLLRLLGQSMYERGTSRIRIRDIEADKGFGLVWSHEGLSALDALEFQGVLSTIDDPLGRVINFTVERVCEQVIGEYVASFATMEDPVELARAAGQLLGHNLAQGPGAIRVALSIIVDRNGEDRGGDYLYGFIDACPIELVHLAGTTLAARVIHAGEEGGASIAEELLAEPTMADFIAAKAAGVEIRERELHTLELAFLAPLVAESRINLVEESIEAAALAVEYLRCLAEIRCSDDTLRTTEWSQRQDQILNALRKFASRSVEPNQARQLTSALNILGLDAVESGTPSEAIGLLNESVKRSQEYFNISDCDDARRDLAEALANLGRAHHANGSPSDAVAVYCDAFHVGSEPLELPEWSPGYLLWDWAECCKELRDFQEAIRIFRILLKHESKLHRWDLASATEARIADVLADTGQMDHALKCIDRSVELARRSGDRTQFVKARSWFGDLLEKAKRFDEALAVRQEVVDLSRQLDDRRRLAVNLEILGDSLRKAKRFEEALQALRDSFAVGMEPSQVEDWNPAIPLNFQAETLDSLERFEDAVVVRQEVVELSRQSDDRRRLAVNLEFLGDSLRQAGRVDEALEAYNESLRTGSEPTVAEGWHANSVLGEIASVYEGVERFDDALAVREDVVRLSRQLDDRRRLAVDLELLGDSLRKAERYHEALLTYNESLRVGSEPTVVDGWTAASVLGEIATVYECLERFDEAVALRQEVVESSRQLGDRRRLVFDLERLGDSLRKAERLDEALQAFRDSFTAGMEPSQVERWNPAVSLGRQASTLEDLEHFDEAAKVRQDVVELSRQLGDRRRLAVDLEWLGGSLRKAERLDEALHAFRESFTVGMEPSPAERWHPAVPLRRQAETLEALERFDEAVKVREDVVELSRKLDDRRRLAVDLECLGDSLRKGERYDEALVTYNESRCIGSEPTVAEGWDAISVLLEIASVCEDLERFDDAVARRQELVELSRQLDYRHPLAVNLELLGNSLCKAGRYEEALQAFSESFTVGMEPSQVDEWNPAIPLGRQAETLEALERFDEALAVREDVVKFSRQLDDRRRLAVDLECLGDSLRKAERYHEALVTYNESLRTGSEPTVVEGWTAASVLGEMATVYECLERFDEAVLLRQGVVESSRQLDDRRRLAVDLERLGDSLRKAERLEEALQAFCESFTVGMEPSQAERWNPAVPLRRQAITLDALERFDEAVKVREDVVALGRQLDDRRRLAVDLELLGDSLSKAGRVDEALEAYNQSLRTGSEPTVAKGWTASSVLGEIASVYEGIERFDDAVAVRREVVELSRQLDDRHRLAVSLECLGDSLRKADRLEEAVQAFRSLVTMSLEMALSLQRSKWIGSTVKATVTLGRALADSNRKIDALEEMDAGRALVEEVSRSAIADAEDLDIAASWWECHADCLESIGDDVYASRARRKAKALRARSAAIE
jgi:tetratricopeptide (TPR) repeat protein